MENLLLMLATSFAKHIAAPRFRRYVVCPGCSALLNSAAKTLQVRRTKEGDRLYFNDYTSNGVTYGVVCVQMKDVYTIDKAENILVQFLNRARKPMHVRHNLSMEVEKTARLLTISDYWQDRSGIDWKIKAYTNGKIAALVYVKNFTNASVKAHDAYLNGFRFSAVK